MISSSIDSVPGVLLHTVTGRVLAKEIAEAILRCDLRGCSSLECRFFEDMAESHKWITNGKPPQAATPLHSAPATRDLTANANAQTPKLGKTAS